MLELHGLLQARHALAGLGVDGDHGVALVAVVLDPGLHTLFVGHVALGDYQDARLVTQELVGDVEAAARGQARIDELQHEIDQLELLFEGVLGLGDVAGVPVDERRHDRKTPKKKDHRANRAVVHYAMFSRWTRSPARCGRRG
ncbi:hypothetical protein D3C72_1327430 [compost metagenome]